MSTASPRPAHLEGVLAKLLYYGTWLASSAIAVGLAIAFFNSTRGAENSAETLSLRLATSGIALLILLPILRVSLMLWFLLRSRDYQLAIAAALVLTIIFAGVVVGARSVSGVAP